MFVMKISPDSVKKCAKRNIWYFYCISHHVKFGIFENNHELFGLIVTKYGSEKFFKIEP